MKETYRIVVEYSVECESSQEAVEVFRNDDRGALRLDSVQVECPDFTRLDVGGDGEIVWPTSKRAK